MSLLADDRSQGIYQMQEHVVQHFPKHHNSYDNIAYREYRNRLKSLPKIVENISIFDRG